MATPVSIFRAELIWRDNRSVYQRRDFVTLEAARAWLLQRKDDWETTEPMLFELIEHPVVDGVAA